MDKTLTVVPERELAIRLESPDAPRDKEWLKAHPRNAELIKAAKDFIRYSEKLLKSTSRLLDYKEGTPGYKQVRDSYINAHKGYDDARIRLETVINEVS